MTLPNHIAIIMDGNGRWGLKNYNSRLIGHKFGIKNIKKIIDFCLKKKIKNLTIYAFSKDNFKRSDKEINNIFSLFIKYFKENKNYFNYNKISLSIIGQKKELPKNILSLIKKINKKKTKDSKININVAFNYSSKDEIIFAFQKAKLSKKKFTNSNIEKNLYTHRSGDPDILIRTGATKRLSDFLLWQLSYTEIFFLNKMWPDFTPNDLNVVINKFDKIKRKFGSDE